MNTNSPDVLLTATETAQRLRVHYDTMARWRSVGQGPAYVKLCATYRYPAEELEAWIRRESTTPERESPRFRQSTPDDGRQ